MRGDLTLCIPIGCCLFVVFILIIFGGAISIGIFSSMPYSGEYGKAGAYGKGNYGYDNNYMKSEQYQQTTQYNKQLQDNKQPVIYKENDVYDRQAGYDPQYQQQKQYDEKVAGEYDKKVLEVKYEPELKKDYPQSEYENNLLQRGKRSFEFEFEFGKSKMDKAKHKGELKSEGYGKSLSDYDSKTKHGAGMVHHGYGKHFDHRLNEGYSKHGSYQNDDYGKYDQGSYYGDKTSGHYKHRDHVIEEELDGEYGEYSKEKKHKSKHTESEFSIWSKIKEILGLKAKEKYTLKGKIVRKDDKDHGYKKKKSYGNSYPEQKKDYNPRHDEYRIAVPKEEYNMDQRSNGMNSHTSSQMQSMDTSQQTQFGHARPRNGNLDDVPPLDRPVIMPVDEGVPRNGPTIMPVNNGPRIMPVNNGGQLPPPNNIGIEPNPAVFAAEIRDNVLKRKTCPLCK